MEAKKMIEKKLRKTRVFERADFVRF